MVSAVGGSPKEISIACMQRASTHLGFSTAIILEKLAPTMLISQQFRELASNMWMVELRSNADSEAFIK